MNNFRNNWPMKLIFLSEHWKFNVNSKNAKELQQKLYGFLDNLIWIGNGKLSLLLREYSWLAVNVLNYFTWLKSVWYFYGCLPTFINQHLGLIHSWHVTYSIFGITFDMPRCNWPHPYDWTKSGSCIYLCLTTSKKPCSKPSSFLR